MPDRGTKKKITRVGGGEAPPADPAGEERRFVPSQENKSKAGKLRLFAIISWIVAIGFEIGAIFMLQKPPIQTTWLIVLIVADLIFAVTGILLWKRSNRLDPASEKQKIKFFIQNQLGAIIAVIAFLPLIILIFANKDLKGKQKGLVGVVAIIALLIAGFLGIDFNPPSVEKYAEETAQVEALTGANFVYWTEFGTRYHLYSDCHYINTDRTDEIMEGTVAQARKLKNITQLCSACRSRAEKEKSSRIEPTTEVEEDTE